MLQLSDFFQTTAQLRALMDARNSSDAWDLRCYVREKLIAYIKEHYPQSLPRYRAELDTPNAVASEDGPNGATNRLGSAPQSQVSARKQSGGPQ